MENTGGSRSVLTESQGQVFPKTPQAVKKHLPTSTTRSKTIVFIIVSAIFSVITSKEEEEENNVLRSAHLFVFNVNERLFYAKRQYFYGFSFIKTV